MRVFLDLAGQLLCVISFAVQQFCVGRGSARVCSTVFVTNKVVLGNEYLVTQVWTVGQNVARNPLSSKKAMESASTGERPEMFAVVALADRR